MLQITTTTLFTEGYFSGAFFIDKRVIKNQNISRKGAKFY
jgi:hypothetical protein